MRSKQAWWRWVIVAGGCMTNVLVFGVLNASGVIYVGVLSTYRVSHAEAAWVTLAVQALANLIGPCAALLGSVFSYRKVVISSGIVSCISLIMSFFVNEVKYLILTYGVLLGIGLGLSIAPTIITIGMHFEKWRAVANGICFAGSAIGSFIIPTLLEYLEEHYGLQGTFLVMAGMVLNLSVCGSLYRPAPEQTSTVAETRAVEAQNEEEIKPFIENSSNSGSDSKDSDSKAYSKLESQNSKADVNSYDIPEVIIAPALFDKINDVKSSSLYDQRRLGEDDEALMYENGIEQGRPFVIKATPVTKRSSVTNDNEPDSGSQLEVVVQPSCLSRFSFLHDEFFILIACGWSCLLYSLSCILLILPDYAITSLDNVSKADSALLISAFASGDLVGRLGYGWLSDMKLFPSKYGYMASIMTAGLACLLAPLCASYETLMAVCALYGLGVGCTIIQHPGLMIEYLGMEVFRRGYGFLSCIAGLTIIGMAPVIGALRESTGSYIANFILTGCILMCAGLLWLLEPVALRRQKRRRLLPSS